MKQKQWDWLIRMAAAVLLAGAIGIIIWQGIQYLSAEKADTIPRRLQVMTSALVTSTTSATSAFFEETTRYTMHHTTMIAAASQTTAAKTVQTPDFPLELNEASAKELEQLPGIGTVLAERITAYRMQLGGFSNRDQLLEVDGIGTEKLAQIYDLIYVTNEMIPEPEPQEESEQYAEPVEPQNAPEPEHPMETVSTEPPVFDLNTASKEDLLLLPDMTSEMAEKIVAFRTENQYYSSVYELLYIDGMTETYFAKIRDYVQIACLEMP